MSTADRDMGQPPGQLPPLLSQFPPGQALPYTLVQKGVELPGEVVVSPAWQPELGVITAPSVRFRIVFLTDYQEVPASAVAHSRVAVCIPVSPPLRLREPRAGYQTGPVSSGAIQEEAVAYAAGHIVAQESLALSPPSLFSPTRPADWVEGIIAALFPATWESALPYASLLAPEIKSEPPQSQAPRFEARLREWPAKLGRLASALAQITTDLGPPGDSRFEEAIGHLARVCRHSGLEEFYLEAVATYGSPSALAADLSLVEKLDALAAYLPEIISTRNYLGGAVIGDSDQELAMDRQSLLEQINADYLLANPHLWPSLKALFDWFQERYRSAYLAHFQRWQQQMKQLQQLLQAKEREVRALHYLNSIVELGEPEGVEVLEAYGNIRERIKPCPLDSIVESLLHAVPVCPHCDYKLTDEAPVAEVNEFVSRLEQALKEQQRRLSSQAIGLILRRSREPRLQQFLQVVQASDLSSLVGVLDEGLVAFIRQLLRQAKGQT